MLSRLLSFLVLPMLLGLLAALAAGWLLIPVLRRLKVGQIISTDAPKQHLAKGGTPTMGGAIILLGALGGVLFFRGPMLDYGLLVAVWLCTLGFGAVGFLDDYLIVKRGKNLGLRAREKLAGQFVVAILFAGWYYYQYFLNDPVANNVGRELLSPGRLLLCVCHVIIMVGMSNSVNLTDGLDGLAAGVSLPVWITLALLALAGSAATGISSFAVVVFCAAFAGATLGYLWYNAHPAQVFMGDTGSLAIGGGMAAAAIALHLEWILLLAALVHLAEAASVTAQVISFKTTGKRIFKMSPVHHHFEQCGLPETRIVARFTLVSVMCCLLTLALFLRG